MKTVNMHEAVSDLQRLLEAAAEGEEIILAQAGKPVARLVPLTSLKMPRRPGVLKGKIRIGKDFDAPLAEELLLEFERR